MWNCAHNVKKILRLLGKAMVDKQQVFINLAFFNGLNFYLHIFGFE